MLLAANAVPRKVNCSRRRLTSILLQLIRPDVSTATRPLEALADLLERASSRIGHRIFLLSDEPYRPLRFDGRAFTSPAALFPWTLISRSYGKVSRQANGSVRQSRQSSQQDRRRRARQIGVVRDLAPIEAVQMP
jgi:hypothetical protein